MSCPSEEHAPSQPRQTFTPAARYLRIGATPEPRRRFDAGLCTIVAPASAWGGSWEGTPGGAEKRVQRTRVRWPPAPAQARGS